MKLYNSIGPNPKVVRMFLAEKGLELPTTVIDLLGGENRREPYQSDVNPAGQCPALELDDGTVVTEITAICEYIEDIQPAPALIGSTPAEKAETRMWTRRIDLNICEPLTNGFRYSDGLDLFTPRFRCIPEAADGLKAVAQDKLTWLDGLMAGKSFVAGERFTLADVMLFVFLEFGNSVGQPLPAERENITSWFQRVAERPSATV